MAERYNVLLVLADQHHADLLGCAQKFGVLTPNLDAFAASGMRFARAYCQNPICTPSRVSILSGQYCHNHGYYGLSGPAPAGLDNFFRHFQRNGYRTAAFGKLHLPDSPRNWIADDVDEFGDTYEDADGTRGISPYLRELEKRGLRELEDSWYNEWNYGAELITQDACPSRLPYEHTQEMWSARKAMEFMDQSEEPFCIQVAFQKPHHPLLPNERFWDLYPEDVELPATFRQNPSHRPPHFQRAFEKFRAMKWDFARPGETFEDGARRAWRGTLACVSQVDDVFGRLLKHLKARGLDSNTIVIYGSDHGAYHGIHGIQEKAPGICSEAVCRVPSLWRVPGVTPADAVCSEFVENVDIVPTVTALCGLPSFTAADGRDITPLLQGEEVSLRAIAVTENPWSKALRWKNWRYVHYQRTMFSGRNTGELYDLEEDPDETCNLYEHKEYQEVVQECRQLLLEWLIDTRRVATSQPTSKINQGPNYQKGIRFTYAIGTDGTAPNDAQPRGRGDLPEAYL